MTDEHRVITETYLPAIESKPKRLARELIDNLGVKLRAVKFDLERFTRDTQPGLSDEQRTQLNAISRKLAGTVDDMQWAALRPPPAMLEDLGAVASLKWFVGAFTATFPQIEVFSDINVAETDVPYGLHTPLFQVVQEAFINIAKHSKATEASLILSPSNRKLYVTIKDNGCGFTLPADNGGQKGMGLYAMRERLLGSGGALNIRSTVGTGTVLNVEWAL